MPQFKVEGGSFGTGIGYFDGNGFTLPGGSSWKGERVPTSLITSAEIASAESLKKLGGTLGWGAAGLIALGPLGMFAGLLAGGRKNVATFIVTFNNGKQFVATGDHKVWTAIKAAALTVAAQQASNPTKALPDTASVSAVSIQRTANGTPQEMLAASCSTWGWLRRSQPKPDFRRFDVFACTNGTRTMGVAITPDPVTDHSLGLISEALDKIKEAERKFIVAPSVGQSVVRRVKRLGVVILQSDQINDTVAQW